MDFSYNGTDYNATYKGFSLSSVTDNYTLSLTRFVSGNTSDDLYAGGVGGDDGVYYTVHKQPFSTVDNDHDNWPGNCAAVYGRAGWWCNNCGWTTPNGRWNVASPHGMHWNSVTDYRNSISWTELKVRVPQGVNFTDLDTSAISVAGVACLCI